MYPGGAARGPPRRLRGPNDSAERPEFDYFLAESENDRCGCSVLLLQRRGDRRQRDLFRDRILWPAGVVDDCSRRHRATQGRATVARERREISSTRRKPPRDGDD